MLKINKQTYHDLKLSLFWLILFALILSNLAIYLLWQRNSEISIRLENCQHNFAVWEKQIKSGHVVLELEGGVKEGE